MTTDFHVDVLHLIDSFIYCFFPSFFHSHHFTLLTLFPFLLSALFIFYIRSNEFFLLYYSIISSSHLFRTFISSSLRHTCVTFTPVLWFVRLFSIYSTLLPLIDLQSHSLTRYVIRTFSSFMQMCSLFYEKNNKKEAQNEWRLNIIPTDSLSSTSLLPTKNDDRIILNLLPLNTRLRL